MSHYSFFKSIFSKLQGLLVAPRGAVVVVVLFSLSFLLGRFVQVDPYYTAGALFVLSLILPQVFPANSGFNRVFVQSEIFLFFMRLMLAIETLFLVSPFTAFLVGCLFAIVLMSVKSEYAVIQAWGYVGLFLILCYLRCRNSLFTVGDLLTGPERAQSFSEAELSDHFGKKLGIPGFKLNKSSCGTKTRYVVGSPFTLSKRGFFSPGGFKSALLGVFHTYKPWFYGAATGAVGSAATYVAVESDQQVKFRNLASLSDLQRSKMNVENLQNNVISDSAKNLLEDYDTQYKVASSYIYNHNRPFSRIFSQPVEFHKDFKHSYSVLRGIERDLTCQQAELASQRALELSFKQGQIKHYQEINSWNARWGGSLLGKKELPHLPSGLAEHKVSMAPVLRSIESIPKVPCTWEWNIWSFLF